MKPHDQPNGLCSVDPITLGTIALSAAGSLAGAAAGGAFKSPSAPPAAPAAPAPPAAAAPASTPTTTKPEQKPMTPTFLGSADLPKQAGFGSKTLLGQ